MANPNAARPAPTRQPHLPRSLRRRPSFHECMSRKSTPSGWNRAGTEGAQRFCNNDTHNYKNPKRAACVAWVHSNATRFRQLHRLRRHATASGFLCRHPGHSCRDVLEDLGRSREPGESFAAGSADRSVSPPNQDLAWAGRDPRLCWNGDTPYSARSMAQCGARLDAASAPGQFAWNKPFQRWFSP